MWLIASIPFVALLPGMPLLVGCGVSPAQNVKDIYSTIAGHCCCTRRGDSFCSLAIHSVFLKSLSEPRVLMHSDLYYHEPFTELLTDAELPEVLLCTQALRVVAGCRALVSSRTSDGSIMCVGSVDDRRLQVCGMCSRSRAAGQLS